MIEIPKNTPQGNCSASGGLQNGGIFNLHRKTIVDSFFLHILSSKITFKLGSCDILSLSRYAANKLSTPTGNVDSDVWRRMK